MANNSHDELEPDECPEAYNARDCIGTEYYLLCLNSITAASIALYDSSVKLSAWENGVRCAQHQKNSEILRSVIYVDQSGRISRDTNKTKEIKQVLQDMRKEKPTDCWTSDLGHGWWGKPISENCP